MKWWQIVSYRVFTSNHNFINLNLKKKQIVSYRVFTSNHNKRVQRSLKEMIVSYRVFTSNHNSKKTDTVGSTLYLIECLHQTTTQILLGIQQIYCIL